MSKQDLIKKISSRKFWVLVAGLATSIVLMIMGDTTITTGGIVMALGSIIAYILGESWIDAERVGSETTNTTISASTTAKDIVENAINKE